MNTAPATATPANGAANTVVTVNGKVVTHIAIEAGDEIERRACGRIVFWTCNGTVTCETLQAALTAATSSAEPPDPPSPLDALHRAAGAVAKIVKGEAHHVSRGRWAVTTRTSEIVEKAEEEEGVQSATDALAEQLTATGALKQLVYDVDVVGSVDKEGVLSVEGTRGATELRTAYNAALAALAPSDVSAWLKIKALKLGAVRLRQRGGIYFIPKSAVVKWEKMVAALEGCSKHKVHSLPSMKSADAVEAILTAVAEDTRKACEKIAAEIADADLGARALKNRETVTADLLKRVEQYEALLGARLDDLRVAIDETRAAVATAALVLASSETEAAP